MTIINVFWLFLFSSLTLVYVDSRDLISQDDEQITFFSSAEDIEGKEFCNNAGAFNYTPVLIYPTNHYLQQSRIDNSKLNDYLQGISSKTEYINDIMIYSIPSLIFTVLSFANSVFLSFYLCHCGFCKFKTTEIYSESMVFVKHVAFMLMVIISLGFLIESLRVSIDLIPKNKQSKCSIALFFDELLAGPNSLYQGETSSQGYGINDMLPMIDVSMKQIIGNNSVFKDLGTFDSLNLTNYNSFLNYYLYNFTTFFSNMAVYTPKFLGENCSRTLDQSNTLCYFQIDISSDAEGTSTGLVLELNNFYIPAFSSALNCIKAFNNIYLEGSTQNITKTINRILQNRISVFKQNLLEARTSIFSIVKEIDILSTIFIALSILSLLCGLISLLMMLFGHGMSEWFYKPWFKKIIYLGAILSGPSVVLLCISNILSIILTMIYSDSCALLQIDNFASRKGFITDNNLKMAFDSIITQSQNVYDIFALRSYFTDIQAILSDGAYLSSVQLQSSLTKFNYTNMNSLLNLVFLLRYQIFGMAMKIQHLSF